MVDVSLRSRLRERIAFVLACLAIGAVTLSAASAQTLIRFKFTLPSGVVGQPYTFNAAAGLQCPTNPSPVFQFIWANPAAVPGLSFATSGLISGTPTTPGNFNLAYTVSDVSQAPGACNVPVADTGVLTIAAQAAGGVVGVSGNNQVVPPSTPVPQPLVARVIDSLGNGIAGVAVTWTPGAGGGTVTNPTLVSNAQGLVQAGFTTGPNAQNSTVTVSVVGAAGSFQFTVLNQQSVVDSPAQEVATPAVVTAVSTPTIQMNNIRQRLDQIRFQRSAAVIQALRVRLSGQALPIGAMGLADGKPATGGAAAADTPDAFSRWGLFINGDVDIGKQSAVDTQSAFKVTSNGITVGTDYRFEGNNVLGAALGFLKADTDVANGGTQDAKGYSFSVYGSWVPAENAYVDGIVNVGRNTYDSQRPQLSGGTATSSTDGNQFGASLSAGWNFNQGGFTGNPYVRVEYVDAKVNGFTESGSPDDALIISEQRVKATTLSLGAQASYAISTSWGVLLPYGKVEFQYLAQSNAQNVTAQLVGITNPASIIPKLGQDKTFGNFAAGASAILPNGFSCFFNYEQLFGKENFKDQRYTIGLRIEL